MEIDLELYRSDIRLPALNGKPPVRLAPGGVVEHVEAWEVVPAGE